MDSIFSETNRFQVISQLGQGGMGIVFSALDNDCGAKVALKTMRELTGEQVLRLKHEFRALQNISHPNLVTLGELYHNDGQWFFTMELVDGTDFMSYVRTGTGFDEAKLRAAFSDLILGLEALHSNGLVHRDVKPDNIIVTQEGRAVLVDFGLCATKPEAQPGNDKFVLGTAQYMAPEQGTSKPIGPESDMYSAGIILYEALLGTSPVTADLSDILRMKQRYHPDPSLFDAAAIPHDLRDICVGLLQPQQGKRPTARDIMALLSISDLAVSKQQRRRRRSTPPFTGRDAELKHLLSRANQSSAQDPQGEKSSPSHTVLICGDSGIGKTALLDEFASRVCRQFERPLVIRSKCRQRETVPYKAFDDIADSLTEFIAKQSKEVQAELGESLQSMAPVFPSFAALPCVSTEDANVTESHLVDRGELFANFAFVLEKIARNRLVAILIDDVHWADNTSISLLAWLMESDARLLFVVTTADPGSHLKPLIPHDSLVELQPLRSEDAVALAGKFLDFEREGKNAISAQLMAMESKGNPAFMRDLVQFASDHAKDKFGIARLEDAVSARIESLSIDARRVLDLVCIFGAPIPQQAVARALPFEDSQFTNIVSTLCAGDFLRTTGSDAHGPLEAKHRLIRETVLAKISASQAVDYHEQLAAAMKSLGLPFDSILTDHWDGCGVSEKTAMYSFLAGEESFGKGAFERAAKMYSRALELTPSYGSNLLELQEKIAVSLSKSGRNRDAGIAFSKAATLASGKEQVLFAAKAADAFLSSGQIERGIATFDAVLPAFDIPAISTVKPWRGIARERFRVTRNLPKSPQNKDSFSRVDICFSVVRNLLSIDVPKALFYQSMHLRMAKELGEPGRLGRAHALEAALKSFWSPLAPHRSIRTARLFFQDAHRLEGETIADLCESFIFMLRGRYRDSLRLARKVEQRDRANVEVASWAVDKARVMSAMANAIIGDVVELCKRQKTILFEAREKENIALEAKCKIGLLNLPWLVRDRPMDALRALKDGADALEPKSAIDDFWILLAGTHIDLYNGDGTQACEKLNAWSKKTKRLPISYVKDVKLQIELLRGRSLLAAFDSDKKVGWQCRRILRLAQSLSEQDSLLAIAGAHILRAGVAVRRGEQAEATYEAEVAEKSAKLAGMELVANSIRLQRGRIVGGPEGAGIEREAEAWFLSQGVINPWKLAMMWAPLGVLSNS